MKSLFLILSIFLLFSCGSNQLSKSNEGERLDFKNTISESMKLSLIVDSVELVPLETKDDFLISGITKMRYADGKFFILDRNQKSIFVFDKKGKPVFKINNYGKGPNEYLNIRGFDINEKTKQLVFKTFPNRLYYYDFDGKLIKEENIDIDAFDIAISDDALIFDTGYLTNIFENERLKYWFLVKSISDNQYKGYKPFIFEEMGDVRRTYQQCRYLIHNGDEVLFFEPFSNIVYSILGDKVSVKYFFDFGDKNIPDDFFSQYNDFEKSLARLDDGCYNYAFNSLWENNDYLSFNYEYASNSYAVCYDKNKKICYNKGWMDDITYCWPYISEATDNYLIGYRPANELMNEISSKKYVSAQKEYLSSIIDAESNPVLFLYYFK